MSRAVDLRTGLCFEFLIVDPENVNQKVCLCKGSGGGAIADIGYPAARKIAVS
jgi:hypothetical protein